MAETSGARWDLDGIVADTNKWVVEILDEFDSGAVVRRTGGTWNAGRMGET